MAKQLVFSSVPHGLQPGRSGYCLVAGHIELPQSLIRQLEQETSVFPEKEAQPRHETKFIGETKWHLFIKQSINLKDYTGRLSGVTHVIAERADQLPSGASTQEILAGISDWVTTIPKAPSTYDRSQDINLLRSPPLATPRTEDDVGHHPSSAATGFKIKADAQAIRPTPRPRSGIYYDRSPKKNSSLWWIIGAALLIAFIVLFVI